jgi:hypothetical protein
VITTVSGRIELAVLPTTQGETTLMGLQFRTMFHKGTKNLVVDVLSGGTSFYYSGNF